MKIFIYKTTIFFISTVLIIVVLFLTTNILINKKASFTLNSPEENLIFGHSHPECAFNDSLISNFKNLSQSRQSYFYSYIKIKKVLSQNKNIKNIFIEYSNNQIAKGMDNWIWDDLSITSRSFYLPFLEQNDLRILYHNNKNALVTGFSKSFRNNLIRIIAFNYDYTKKIGGYKWINRCVSKDKPKDEINQKDFELSKTNIEYLEKIIEYCSVKEVNIYFIRSPQNKYEYYRNNEQIFQKIRKEKFSNIEFLDFNNFPLSDDEFADFGHLNYKGAGKFSIWFNDLIKNGLLTKKNKSEFIKNEIEKVRTHNNAYKALGSK